MSFAAKLTKEIREVGLTTLFFAVCFSFMLLFKALVLAEYKIEFSDFSMALIGALIVAKVVLIMDNIPLGVWLRRRAGFIHVAFRTAMYGLGVFVVLMLERAFEARHEYGGFLSALGQVFSHRDIHHVWATAVGVTSALLAFNALLVIRRHLGERGLFSIFTLPLPERAEQQPGFRDARDLGERN